MRIIFMGTPDFSVPCLNALVDNNYDVVAVFTQPDKPVGRKMVLTEPPVKVCAKQNNIEVYQPVTLKDGKITDLISELKPDVIIVVAYGKILPKEILDIPKYGCINIHASLLPKYRGAAPIQWSIINGDKLTGVTSMQMDIGMDTGDILLKKEIEIDKEETAGELFGRLSELGAKTLIETLDLLKKGALNPIKQDENLATYVKILDKSLCPIDWNDTALNIHNKIRGLNPWPVATTLINGTNVKVYASKVVEINLSNQKPGEVLISDNRFVVACGFSTAIEILEVQSQGGKRMSVSDFLRGHHINVGEILRS